MLNSVDDSNVEASSGVAQSIAEMFAAVSDPRKRRGRRHTLRFILSVAAAATLSGERSLTAIGEWAADQDAATLRRLGSSNGKAPSEATIRRNLSHPEVAKELDAKTCALVAALGGRLSGKSLAIDGKTLRGSRDGETVGVHLVSAVVHDRGAVVSQVRVPDKSNELAAVVSGAVNRHRHRDRHGIGVRIRHPRPDPVP